MLGVKATYLGETALTLPENVWEKEGDFTKYVIIYIITYLVKSPSFSHTFSGRVKAVSPR